MLSSTENAFGQDLLPLPAEGYALGRRIRRYRRSFLFHSNIPGQVHGMPWHRCFADHTYAIFECSEFSGLYWRMPKITCQPPLSITEKDHILKMHGDKDFWRSQKCKILCWKLSLPGLCCGIHYRYGDLRLVDASTYEKFSVTIK